MRILVVDDEAFVRKFLVRQLARISSAEVLSFDGAGAALKTIAAGHSKSDLIFCDLQMPGMDGLEFIRHLANLSYVGALVLVSGEDEQVLLAAQKAACARGLLVLGALHKPLSQAQLQEVVKLAHREAIPASFSGEARNELDALRFALEEGELVNLYRPQVDLATHEVVCMSASLGWRHLGDDLQAEDALMQSSVADGTLSRELALFVLQGAIKDARGWRNAGRPCGVTVSIPGELLADLAFPDLVERLARDASLPLEDLILEVRSNHLLVIPSTWLETVARLRLKRVKLALDDFLAVSSSRLDIADLPFSQVKLSPEVLLGAGADSSQAAIAEAWVSIAHQLGLTVAADVMESNDDYELLQAIGCDRAQGDFFGPALQGPDVVPWIERWSSQGRSSRAAGRQQEPMTAVFSRTWSKLLSVKWLPSGILVLAVALISVSSGYLLQQTGDGKLVPSFAVPLVAIGSTQPFHLHLTGAALVSALLLFGLLSLIVKMRYEARGARLLARSSQALSAHLSLRHAELRASRKAQQELSSYQTAAREAERKRIAQEIHDELGQRLTVLRMDVSLLARSMTAEPSARLHTHLSALKTSIDDILSIVRDIATRLRPATLDFGLVAAAEGLVAEFQMSLGIPCELDSQLPPDFRLEDELATGVFRILQEALTNAARHAVATHIEVTLTLDDEYLVLRVKDDGRGFAVPATKFSRSFGVTGMRERATSLGGDLEIRSRSGQGTVVEMRLSLESRLDAKSHVAETAPFVAVPSR